MSITSTTTPKRRIDLIDIELAHSRISPAAVAVARGLEAALDAAQRSAGSAWREKVDGASDAETGALAGLDAVFRARLALLRVERIVGTRGAILLRDLIIDGLSFDELAARHGRNTRRGIASVASQVRADLETLARAFAARGKPNDAPPDKYDSAAGRTNHRKRVPEPV